MDEFDDAPIDESLIAHYVSLATLGIPDPWSKYRLAPTPVTGRCATEWLWPGFLLKGKLTLFDAKGSSGKTRLFLGIASCLGRGFFPFGVHGESCEVPMGRSLLITSEDDAEEIAGIYQSIGGIHGTLLVLNPAEVGGLELDGGGLEELETYIWVNQVSLICLDPVLQLLPRDVKGAVDPQGVTRFLSGLQGICARLGCTMILMRHFAMMSTGRDINQYGAGPEAWRNVSRGQWILLPHPESNSRPQWMECLVVSGRNTISTRYEPYFAFGVDHGVQAWIHPDSVDLEPYMEKYTPLRAFLGMPPIASNKGKGAGRPNAQCVLAAKLIVDFLLTHSREWPAPRMIKMLSSKDIPRTTGFRARDFLVDDGTLVVVDGVWRLAADYDQFADVEQWWMKD